MDETFECAWCRDEGQRSPAEYTRPIAERGGYDNRGHPICEDCAAAEMEEEATR